MTGGHSEIVANPPNPTKIKKKKKKKSYKALMKSIMKPKTTEEERKKQKENQPIVNARFSKVDKI